MSLSDTLTLIAGVIGMLTLIHAISSAPREKNLRFYNAVGFFVLASIAIAGLYFVYQFVRGEGSPSRIEIFNFVTWGINLIWSSNAMIVLAFRRKSGS